FLAYPIPLAKALVALHDRLLDFGSFWSVRGGRKQPSEDVDRALMVAGVVELLSQPSDQFDSALWRGVLLEVGKPLISLAQLDEEAYRIHEGFVLEVENLVAARVGEGDHLLELLESAARLAGVVVAPGQLVERVGIDFRDLAGERLLVVLPRHRQI